MSEARWGEYEPAPSTSANSVYTSFDKLLCERRTTGFVDLVRPLTFEEQCEEQRRIRDLSDGTYSLEVSLEMLPLPPADSLFIRGRTFQEAKAEMLARLEREYFTYMYQECKGSVSDIARKAKCERAHVRGYLYRHGIMIKQPKPERKSPVW